MAGSAAKEGVNMEILLWWGGCKLLFSSYVLC